MPAADADNSVGRRHSAEGLVTIEAWLAAATADAERRGLPELKELLEGLARATAALRSAHFSAPRE